MQAIHNSLAIDIKKEKENDLHWGAQDVSAAPAVIDICSCRRFHANVRLNRARDTIST